MIVLVKLFGIFIICMGFLILLNPRLMKRMIVFWKQGKRLYLGALIRILFGVVFLLSASQARLSGVMVGLGIFSLLAGMLIFILGLNRLKAILDWWDKKPDLILRLVSLIILAFGALVIYSA